jgi:hypothetical protein
MKDIEISQPSDDREPNDQDCATANEGDVTATGVFISGGRRALPICRIRDAEPSRTSHPAEGEYPAK